MEHLRDCSLVMATPLMGSPHCAHVGSKQSIRQTILVRWIKNKYIYWFHHKISSFPYSFHHFPDTNLSFIEGHQVITFLPHYDLTLWPWDPSCFITLCLNFMTEVYVTIPQIPCLSGVRKTQHTLLSLQLEIIPKGNPFPWRRSTSFPMELPPFTFMVLSRFVTRQKQIMQRKWKNFI